MKSILILIVISLPFVDASAQRSMYQDVKAHRPGDIITVLLVENVSGSSSLNASLQSNVNGNATGNLTGNVLPFTPTFGGESGFGMNSGERVNSNQSQLLRGSVSVRIVRIEAPGLFYVEGMRELEINGDRYAIHLSGHIRSLDIDSMNQILSTRIADADIHYVAKDRILTTPRKTGFFRRTLWVLGTGSLIAAAILMRG